jgi:hypothetical protein
MSETTTETVRTDDADRPVSLEAFVTGRLTLQVLHHQLEIQIATLRSQLTIAELQLRQADQLLKSADKKMAAQYPDAFAQLAGTDAGAVARTPKRSRS